MTMSRLLAATALAAALIPATAHANAPAKLKAQAAADVDAQAKLVQEMVDSMFSFAGPRLGP